MKYYNELMLNRIGIILPQFTHSLCFVSFNYEHTYLSKIPAFSLTNLTHNTQCTYSNTIDQLSNS